MQASARSLSNVTKQTLDTRVSLARLRAAHPAPRLTTSSALALLGTQEGTMQALQDELDRAADRKEELKADVEERTRAVGRLGVRRAEVEREARAAAAARGGRGEAERRVAEYVEWCVLRPFDRIATSLSVISAAIGYQAAWHSQNRSRRRTRSHAPKTQSTSPIIFLHAHQILLLPRKRRCAN